MSMEKEELHERIGETGEDVAGLEQDKEELRERIGRARENVAGLEQDLAAVDAELGSHSAERNRYELLEQVCESLEELERQDAAALFWGAAGDAGQVQDARRRIEAFASEMSGIENRRRAIVEQIEAGNESLGWLGEDLVDVLAEEESRKSEWVIEREERLLPYRPQVMPWMRGLEEDGRFRRSLASAMSIALLLGVVFQLVVLPVAEREELMEVPERVVQLIEQRQIVEPPEPVVREPVPEEPEPEEEPEPLVAEETPPEPELAAEPAPAAQQASVKERVQSKGILAFRESFASLAASAPAAQLGSQASLSNAGEAAVGLPERAMVTTAGPGSSGGINLASISRDIGGGGAGQIAGVRVTQVESSIGGGGTADRPLSAGRLAGRTDEEIQIVFDRYKAALYRLYNRALRDDPTLRGQLVVRLTIEPDGSVSLCELLSSDMDAPALASQVIERIRTFDFGAKEEIVAMTIIYPIDFLPAA